MCRDSADPCTSFANHWQRWGFVEMTWVSAMSATGSISRRRQQSAFHPARLAHFNGTSTRVKETTGCGFSESWNWLSSRMNIGFEPRRPCQAKSVCFGSRNGAEQAVERDSNEFESPAV